MLKLKSWIKRTLWLYKLYSFLFCVCSCSDLSKYLLNFDWWFERSMKCHIVHEWLMGLGIAELQKMHFHLFLLDWLIMFKIFAELQKCIPICFCHLKIWMFKIFTELQNCIPICFCYRNWKEQDRELRNCNFAFPFVSAI